MTTSTHPVDCENGWVMCHGCGGVGYIQNWDEEDLMCRDCLGMGGEPCPVCDVE